MAAPDAPKNDNPKQPKQKSQQGARYVYGKNSVKALLDLHPDRVFKIFLSDSLKPDKRIEAVYEATRLHRIPVQTVPRQRLDQMLRNIGAESGDAHSQQNSSDIEEIYANHQGIIASVAAKTLLDMSNLLRICKEKQEKGLHPRVLLLDGITDPRNFGAILRVVDASGVDGVIIPKHSSAGFGPGVSKTASGAEETVNIAVVANLNNAMQQLKDAGFWIAGAAHESNAVDYHRQDYQMPMALVVGSEDKGLASLIQKNCDFLIKIPMRGTVDSLNVAAATAVLLFEMVKQS